MQTFLDVCCQELLYYAAFVAVVRENRNFGINRYFTEHSLTYLIRADATLQNPSGMLRRTLLVLLCRTWCVRRCRLSAGFISPHLVYAVLGTSMPQLASSLSSMHLLRAHVQPQRDMWAFDTVTLRCVLSCNLVRTFYQTFLWVLDTVILRYVLSCGLVRVFCHDDPVGLVYGRNTCFQISPRECNFAIVDPTVNANALLAPRTNDDLLH